MTQTQIYAVIHHLDDATTLREADLAFAAGAQGVMLISHAGQDNRLAPLGTEIKGRHPAGFVGLNFLLKGPLAALGAAIDYRLDGIWGDNCGVSSRGATALAVDLSMRNDSGIRVFAGVAFKHQPYEPDPSAAARNALACGFIPTTSGAATGVAAPVARVREMSMAAEGRLAIASGITPENFPTYAGLLSHVLVATGVARDEHHIDPERLARLVAIVATSRACGQAAEISELAVETSMVPVRPGCSA